MKTINRRTWIRTSALMAGGAAFLRGSVEKLSAMPVLKRAKTTAIKEQTFLESIPPELKARLNANENPFGPSPTVKKAIQDTIDAGFRYPMALYSQLIQKIADAEGVLPTNVLTNSGSTPLLLAAAIEYSKGGKNIITGDPSYADLPASAELVGGKWVKVPLTPEYKLDLDAMEAKVDDNTGLVYICNPNNPTGTVLDAEKLKGFIERVSKKATVFVDEAYIDYLPDPKSASMMGAVKSGQNVIVARTFSKLYGFAGLRCGYLVAQPTTVQELNKYTSGGFNISATTMAGAIAGYNETPFLQEALAKTLASKEYLYTVLKGEGYSYIPSSTNFVMFPIKMEGRKFSEEMAKRGVGIRVWLVGEQHYCRVSIGTMDEMKLFAEAFKQIS